MSAGREASALAATDRYFRSVKRIVNLSSRGLRAAPDRLYRARHALYALLFERRAYRTYQSLRHGSANPLVRDLAEQLFQEEKAHLAYARAKAEQVKSEDHLVPDFRQEDLLAEQWIRAGLIGPMVAKGALA
jgi:hypothetical protein